MVEAFSRPWHTPTHIHTPTQGNRKLFRGCIQTELVLLIISGQSWFYNGFFKLHVCELLPKSFLVLACDAWPISKLMDFRVRGLICPTTGKCTTKQRSETLGDAHRWVSLNVLELKNKQTKANKTTCWCQSSAFIYAVGIESCRSHLQLGSLLCTEYAPIGTFSMAMSERSSDFLCFRLHRLRTSSDTVSRAAVMKIKTDWSRRECTEAGAHRAEISTAISAYQPSRLRSAC